MSGIIDNFILCGPYLDSKHETCKLQIEYLYFRSTIIIQLNLIFGKSFNTRKAQF